MKDDDEFMSWSDYIMERCKELFGSDELGNEDVLKYFVLSLKKTKKSVRITQDEIIYGSGYQVSYFDPENKGEYFVLHCGKSEEECRKFIEDNELILSDCKDLM